MNMSGVIEPGRMRARVSIMNPPNSAKVDEWGQPYDPPAFEPILDSDVPAEIEFSAGGESGGNATTGALVKIRYRSDITEKHWFKAGEQRLEILSIFDPDMRQRCLIARCSCTRGAPV